MRNEDGTNTAEEDESKISEAKKLMRVPRAVTWNLRNYILRSKR